MNRWRRVLLGAWLAVPGAVSADFDCFPEEVVPDNLFPVVRVETNMGAFDIELNRLRAPVSSNNFLRYVLDGHYDGTIFHRVVPDFVIQGGGYTRDLEDREERAPIINESGNGLKNGPMSVAMARFDDPHSATSQWFVNLAGNQSLDPNPRSWGYAVFGTVVAGRETVEAIGAVQTGYSEVLDAQDVPLSPVLIERAFLLDGQP